MSQKTAIMKKVHKELRNQKPAIINQIARELLTQPLKDRLRLAKKMAIKAHTDLMEKGQALLDDPNFDIRLKVLVSEEMENSRKCMEGFVRTPENN